MKYKQPYFLQLVLNASSDVSLTNNTLLMFLDEWSWLSLDIMCVHAYSVWFHVVLCCESI